MYNDVYSNFWEGEEGGERGEGGRGLEGKKRGFKNVILKKKI